MKMINRALQIAIVATIFSCQKVDLSTQTKEVFAKQDSLPENAIWNAGVNFSKKIPTVYISTLGNTIVNEPKVPAQIQIQVGDTLVFKSKIGIEYRGSTSFRLFDQKSFGFELRDSLNLSTDSAIMDFPKQSDFILYAPANDKSLVRNVLIYDLSNQIGMYATRTRYVQLYLNGSYIGLYALMEKIKRDKNRVNITKMGSGDNTGAALTGGYIIKIDKSAGDNLVEGWDADAIYTTDISFRSNYDPLGNRLTGVSYGPKLGSETYFMYEYPKSENLTASQRSYLQTYFNDFEDVLASNNAFNQTTGYAKYIDVNSFIDFFILNEFACNPDAYRLSTFMNKERSGKLKMGPIWDFNIAFGNHDNPEVYNGNKWMYKYNLINPADTWLVNFWWNKLMTDPVFKEKLKARWQQLRSSNLSEANIMNTLNKHIDLLKNNNGIQPHFNRWNLLGVKLPFNSFVGNTYQEELDYLISFIQKRLAWMDAEMNKL